MFGDDYTYDAICDFIKKMDKSQNRWKYIESFIILDNGEQPEQMDLKSNQNEKSNGSSQYRDPKQQKKEQEIKVLNVDEIVPYIDDLFDIAYND